VRLARPRLALAGAALAVAAALLAAPLGVGCAERAPYQPHIVLVVCDALRADHLELYGYGRATAPKLAAWAAGGLVFDRATAPSNWTRPSMQSLLTGRQATPDLLLTPDEQLPADAATLAERLSAAGYETAAVSANPFVSAALGAARGFDNFVDLGWKGSERSGHWKDDIASPFVLDRVEYLLSSRAKSGKPVFLYVHLMDTHLPYDPPAAQRGWVDPAYAGPIDGSREGYRSLASADAEHPLPEADRQQAIALYDGEIARLDEGLDRLRALVAEQLKDRAVVTVVTADHGEAFGEPPLGVYMHGRGLGPELLRVPLVIHGVRPEGRVGARVGLVDLGPTLAQLGGATLGDDVDGIALITREGRLNAPPGRELVAYRALPGEGPAAGELAVLRDQWRAMRQGREWRLVEDDSGEDMSLVHPEIVSTCEQAAMSWMATARARRERAGEAARAERVELPEGADEDLKALGYLGR